MKNRVPQGFTTDQWAAVTHDLEAHPSTVNDYRKVINRLHADSPYNIFTITPAEASHLFDVLDEKADNGELSAATVHRYKATLRSVGARIEKTGIMPGYVNPFQKLVRNENRSRTEWSKKLFADAESISRIRSIMNELSIEDQAILCLMINGGFTPAQIENIRVCDFHTEDDHLMLDLNCGTFQQKSDRSWKESEFNNGTYPVRYVRTASTARSITWEYTGTLVISQRFAAHLKQYYDLTGTSKDERCYFLTARHLPYNYRAMHHMVNHTLQKAGLSDSGITPKQLALSGRLRSWLQDDLERHNESEKCRRILMEDSVGSWKDRYPLPMEKQVEEILNFLSKDEIIQLLGLAV